MKGGDPRMGKLARGQAPECPVSDSDWKKAESRAQGSQMVAALHLLLPPPGYSTALASSRPLLKGHLLNEASPDHYLNTLLPWAFLFAPCPDLCLVIMYLFVRVFLV